MKTLYLTSRNGRFVRPCRVVLDSGHTIFLHSNYDLFHFLSCTVRNFYRYEKFLRKSSYNVLCKTAVHFFDTDFPDYSIKIRQL